MKNYLKQVADMVPSIRNKKDNYQYQSMEELILNEGVEFKAQKRPKHIPKLKNKMCFRNAFRIAELHGYIYCEGYALSVIPTYHAWCIDREGNVIDPTWKNSEKCSYYGIPFKLEFIRETMYKTGHYGVINDWKNQWPLCKKFDKNVKEIVRWQISTEEATKSTEGKIAL